MCDPDTGVCEIPGLDSSNSQVITKVEKLVKVIYFTDPICSSCWGIEPQLRKLKLEYGNSIEVEYHMGGLLPDWSYNSGGISKPSDVAHHWDEVSIKYEMPIDGDVWLEDPLHSSYPPSIAFKAAQLQSEEKAILFLRRIREMVFLEKKNITKWEHIEQAANEVGLQADQLKTDFEGRGKELFEADLRLAHESGVRGFPTIFFVDAAGNNEKVYGTKPYSVYEAAMIKMAPAAIKVRYAKDWESLFKKYNTLTAKEYSELAGVSGSEGEGQLNDLVDKGLLKKVTTKNGSIWRY